MDKYLIKTPKEKNPSKPRQCVEHRMKQSTIESLKGVVVVEEILRLKSLLKLENQTSENILDALKTLEKKIPPREVLKETKIGHVINKLTKHINKDVQALATRIVKDWKSFYEEKLDKPAIEVRCDNQTEKLRKTGRKLLGSALGLSEKHSLPEAIERETFHQHGRLINVKYRSSLRALVFTLKNKPDVRQQVLNNQLDIVSFVKLYKKHFKKT